MHLELEDQSKEGNEGQEEGRLGNTSSVEAGWGRVRGIVDHSESFSQSLSVGILVSDVLACSVGQSLGLGRLARGVQVISELRADSEFSRGGISSRGNVRGALESTGQKVDLFLASSFNGASVRLSLRSSSFVLSAARVGVVPCTSSVISL